MLSRKRTAMSSAEAPSSKKQRDDRARQRAAIRDQAQCEQGLHDQARRDQALLDKTRRKESAAAEISRQKALRANITSLNAVNSPLLRLPAELRNIIYDYVFKGAHYKFDQHVYNGCWYGGVPSLDNHLGLSLASRQLHAESSLLLYKLSVFEFDLDVTEECPYGDEYDPDCGYGHRIALRDFLRSRPAKQMKAIAKIEVTVSYTGNMISKETTTGGDWSKELLER